MRLKKHLVLYGLVLLFGLMIFAQDNQNELSMSLEDCIIKALENNLNIKIEWINPQISKKQVTRALDKYLPVLSLSLSKENTENASSSGLDSSSQVVKKTDSMGGEISQFLPLGGNLKVSLNNNKIDTNKDFQTINPVFGSTLRFELNQPLLKNFGLAPNRKDIVVARNNLEISNTRFKTMLMNTVYSVEEAYWNLVYSIENLKVKKRSLQLAQELLIKNQRSVEIGKIAPIEIKSAEAEVATREADILEAEALVKNNEDQLKTIMNLKSGISDMLVQIIPTDEPKIETKILDLQQVIETAFQYRPDLEEQKISHQNNQIEVRFAKNQLLPDVNLKASYWSPGTSGTQILYKDNNPLTKVVVGKIPGGGSDAMKDAFNFMFPNWSIGFSVNIPLSTLATRVELAIARLNLQQSDLQLSNKEQQIVLEIKNAVRAVQTDFKRISAYRLARELTEQKLTAEEEKFKVGNSTNYNVFLFQRDLATAQSNELKAIIDYNLSLANLEKAMGVILKEKNIKFEGI